MSEPLTTGSSWMYEGVWSGLTRYFRVPRKAPSIPDGRGVTGGAGGAGGSHESFRPGPGFMRYLKVLFWLILLIINVTLSIIWTAITIKNYWVGMFLLPVFLVLMSLPFVIAYLAIHLRFDTTWYVMTDRSLRIRRGIWIIHEVTITYENIQNVSLSQGPLQRFFGISDVIVKTAGGGGEAQQEAFQVSNQGIIEGIANAEEIRDRILSHMRETVTAGLGDELHGAPGTPGNAGSRSRPSWTPEHLAALREIRAEIAMMGSQG